MQCNSTNAGFHFSIPQMGFVYGSLSANWMLCDVLAQRGIHTGLPTLACGLEGFQQISV